MKVESKQVLVNKAMPTITVPAAGAAPSQPLQPEYRDVPSRYSVSIDHNNRPWEG